MGQKDLEKERPQEFGANPLFRNRWSPRALTGEKIVKEDFMALFEAARWAPSSFNGQPWRFVFVTRDSERWGSFFDLLVDFNKSWAKNASVLVLVVSRMNFEYNEEFSRTHSFDTGAAWQNLALQASLSGLVAHAMGGFNHEEARVVANIPEGYEIQAMVAVGKLGKKDDLPDSLKKAEVISGRKDFSEFVFENTMK